MNRPLVVSLLGNLLLAMLVLWLVHRAPFAADRPAVAIAAEISNAPAAAPAAQSALVEAAPEPKPFHWSQLDSGNDYRVYVANLRGIGCPEHIIRAIVRMDVERAFASKRAQLRLDGSGTGPWSQYNEMAFIAHLLGKPATAAEPASSQPAERPARPWQSRQTAPALPLVFQPVDEDALQLTESQRQVLGQLRQQFIDELGGTNQDPNTPAYLARWQAAQPKIDDTLRGLLGSRFYINYRLQTANAAIPGK